MNMIFQVISRFLSVVILLSAFCAENLHAQTWNSPRNIEEINSPNDDFAPVFTPDGTLYFNTLVQDYSQFFTTKFSENAPCSSPKLVGGGLNKPRNHQSYLAFSRDGNIYFSTYRQTETRPFLNIFQIIRNGDSWSAPSPVSALNEDTFTAQAAFSPSGKTLVFSSDRAGGQGGTDLWITTKQPSGVWEKPINMGEVLNSSGNEITPFFASEDSLFFASNGFGGKGGYEIFFSRRVGGVWQSPTPLSELNTEFDESDCVLLPNGGVMFSSNRTGGKGGLDLYYAAPYKAKAVEILPPAEYSIASQVQTLTVEEFTLAESFPLLPYIFFEQNSTELAQDLRKISAQEAQNFSIPNNLPNAIAAYAQSLNIIGKRLRENLDARLTITGCADGSTPDENARLGRARAEAVQSYFRDVWNIPAERLQVAGRGLPTVPSNPQVAEGREENRRVEFSSSNPKVFEPVRLEEISVQTKPAQLELTLDSRPRGIVSAWKFMISHENGVAFSDSGSALPKKLIIPAERLRSLISTEEIAMELVGRDTLGRVGKKELRLPVRKTTVKQQRESAENTNKKIERYSLMLFDFDQATLNTDQKNSLREIAPSIPGGARVIVSGYTDMIGDEAHNLLLAEKRASAVAEHLRKLAPTANIMIEAIGRSNLYDNATPYGRFYSRTVQITIEKHGQ